MKFHNDFLINVSKPYFTIQSTVLHLQTIHKFEAFICSVLLGSPLHLYDGVEIRRLISNIAMGPGFIF